jgi:hypothetical protein
MMERPPTSCAAVAAVQLAKQAGVELYIILAVADMARATTGALTTPRYVDQPQHEWPAWVHESMERLSCYWARR